VLPRRIDSPMDVKIIRAFIASPGGLDAERKAAFDAAEEINRSEPDWS
jgi:hypothetical protein